MCSTLIVLSTKHRTLAVNLMAIICKNPHSENVRSVAAVSEWGFLHLNETSVLPKKSHSFSS